MATGLAAEPDPARMRPLSRDDAAALRAAAQQAASAAFRPKPRPDYMVRYPPVVLTTWTKVRPQSRPSFIPRTAWGDRNGRVMWTRAAMSAVGAQDRDLALVVPRDIAAWCPAYPHNPPEQRRAFWVGMMSALAKHESRWDPNAVGGDGLWYGLLQILPDTARRYGCRARTGAALTDPEDNLACAARIMSRTVTRDRAVAVHDGRWRGVAADWGPMSNPDMIAEMSAWTRQQSYCVPRNQVRPRARPADFARIEPVAAASPERG